MHSQGGQMVSNVAQILISMKAYGSAWEKDFASSIMDNYFSYVELGNLSDKQRNVIKRYAKGRLDIAPGSRAEKDLKWTN
jgi:hypothetical protein